MLKKRMATLDDGCSPNLSFGSRHDGILEVPIIEKPNVIVIPKRIIPFTQRNRVEFFEDTAVGFNEDDSEFSKVLISPDDYVEDFKRFDFFISPDCSLYRNGELGSQIINVIRNRRIGCFFQKRGLYVIPQIRWGSRESYTTDVLPERIAFLGVEKHSIVAIGTYGCSQSRIEKYHFKAGLEEMLKTLEPEVVLVYGSMPYSIFGEYLHTSHFVQYENWTKSIHGGKTNGKW